MAFENGENSIDDRDLNNDTDFLQNRGFNKGYDFIRFVAEFGEVGSRVVLSAEAQYWGVPMTPHHRCIVLA